MPTNPIHIGAFATDQLADVIGGGWVLRDVNGFKVPEFVVKHAGQPPTPRRDADFDLIDTIHLVQVDREEERLALTCTHRRVHVYQASGGKVKCHTLNDNIQHQNIKSQTTTT
jgi:hypothetical protein